MIINSNGVTQSLDKWSQNMSDTVEGKKTNGKTTE